jgi:hypothetical protein
MGLLLMMINGYYTFALYVASYFIIDEKYNKNSDRNYTSGDIIACFLGILYGLLNIGNCTPNIRAIAEGRIAGKIVFDII